MQKLFATLLLGAGLLAPTAARAELIIGLINNTTNPGGSLVTFDSATPGTVSSPVGISGLVGGSGEFVVGIDYRPADGALVALTRQSFGPNFGRGRVYTIDTTTGAATLINAMLTNAMGGAEVLLSEANFFSYGIDFNPVVNALRVVNSNDQNLRIVGGGAGATFVDTDLTGPTVGGDNPNVNAIAYTNNFAGATQTTLYALNTTTTLPTRLQTIGSANFPPGTSPNTGQLFDVAALTPSSVNVFNNSLGFDVSGATGLAYASLRMQPPNDTPTLYTINLATGETTLLGAYGGSGLLYDITVSPGVAAVPEPSSCVLLAVGAGLIGCARLRARRRVA